jgi:hypothetical protein
MLHYFIFKNLTIVSPDCFLAPTDDLERFRCMFSPVDWRLMFGESCAVSPSFGEVVFGVRRSHNSELIGFVRMLFAEKNSDAVELHVGFSLVDFSNKRTAMIACFMIVKLCLSITGKTPVTKVNRHRRDLINWCAKLGFNPVDYLDSHVELCHNGEIETIEEALKKYRNSDLIIKSNFFVSMLCRLLRLKHLICKSYLFGDVRSRVF